MIKTLLSKYNQSTYTEKWLSVLSRWGEFWSCMRASYLSSTSGKLLEPEVLFLPFSWCSLLPPARRWFQQGESDRPTVARAVCPWAGMERAFSAVISNGTPSRVYGGQQVCGRDSTVLPPDPGSGSWAVQQEMLVPRGGAGGAVETPLPVHFIPPKRRSVL